MILKGYYRVEEVCARFQINRKTVTRWIKSGKLKPFVPGARRLFFKISDIDKIWDGKERRGTTRG